MNDASKTSGQLRSIPSVDAVLREQAVVSLSAENSPQAVANLIRDVLTTVRNSVKGGASAPDATEVARIVTARAKSTWSAWPLRVINATGVVLHTNLGRAPLSASAVAAAASAAGGYSDLEFDLETGKRGSRNSHISRLVSDVTGAEAAMAVNNNASAVLLTLSALANGREVIVSRGESVEIGGGFRVPDVMLQSGAKLIEVGTTNRTYARDYDAAVTERTAAILKVHPSNFSVQGFTNSPEFVELVAVGRKHNVPVLNDLGSGSLIDTRRFGMEREPTVQDSVTDGASLTMFSGDKLLGGPQAGIVCGHTALVDLVAKHPLARAVRIDKMTLAALSATLLSYLKEQAEIEIPIWRMISASAEEIEKRARNWQKAAGEGEVKPGRSTVGGGSLPGETLSTYVLAIGNRRNPVALAAALRRADPPVIARIHEDELLLDPRTVLPEEDEPVVSALVSALSATEESRA